MDLAKELLGKFRLSAAVLLLCIAWIEFFPISFSDYGTEDYVIENLTAVLFLIASVGFFITAKKSSYLKSKNSKAAYFMIIAWALLMFVFFGEEISWGQRIFDFSTPDALLSINKQQEFTVHNIEVIDNLGGGKYRYLSIMMILTGGVFPLLALTSFGKKLFQKFSYPICPLHLGVFFLGSYIFGKYYADIDIPQPNSVSEFREFIFGIGMACFAWYGVSKPNALFLEKD